MTTSTPSCPTPLWASSFSALHDHREHRELAIDLPHVWKLDETRVAGLPVQRKVGQRRAREHDSAYPQARADLTCDVLRWRLGGRSWCNSKGAVLEAAVWLGAVLAYLVVAIAGLTSLNVQRVNSTYMTMELMASFVIVPYFASEDTLRRYRG